MDPMLMKQERVELDETYPWPPTPPASSHTSEEPLIAPSYWRWPPARDESPEKPLIAASYRRWPSACDESPAPRYHFTARNQAPPPPQEYLVLTEAKIRLAVDLALLNSSHLDIPEVARIKESQIHGKALLNRSLNRSLKDQLLQVGSRAVECHCCHACDGCHAMDHD